MKFFSKCEGCKKQSIIIRKRTYHIKEANNLPITSKSLLCGTCYRSIRKLIK